MSFLADEEALHDAAREATGHDDFGQDPYHEGLRVLLASLDEEARLNDIGRMAMRGMIVEALAGRLLCEAGVAANPGCTDTAIERPLVVIGLPRTGTTALHRLLACDPALQGLALWLSQTPKRRPPRTAWADDPHFQRCDATMRALHERSPDMQAIHDMQAAEVDECWRLLAQSFAHSSWEANAHLPSYSRWWAQHDMRGAYARHRRNLQLIGHGDARRWLLKDSTHLFDLAAFLDTYPDAMIVHTHRDPVKLIPSVCSLCWTARGPLNEGEDRAAFARDTMALWERAIANAMEARAGRDPAQFFDLELETLQADPLAATTRVYEHFGLPLGAEAESAMRAWRDANPPGKHGSHRTDAPEWGLDVDEIRERFSDYWSRFAPSA